MRADGSRAAPPPDAQTEGAIKPVHALYATIRGAVGLGDPQIDPAFEEFFDQPVLLHSQVALAGLWRVFLEIAGDLQPPAQQFEDQPRAFQRAAIQRIGARSSAKTFRNVSASSLPAKNLVGAGFRHLSAVMAGEIGQRPPLGGIERKLRRFPAASARLERMRVVVDAAPDVMNHRRHPKQSSLGTAHAMQGPGQVEQLRRDFRHPALSAPPNPARAAPTSRGPGMQGRAARGKMKQNRAHSCNQSDIGGLRIIKLTEIGGMVVPLRAVLIIPRPTPLIPSGLARQM